MKKRYRAGGDVWKYGASISGRRQIEEKWTNKRRDRNCQKKWALEGTD